MTIQKLIMDTLAPFGYPVVPDVYDGGEKKYFTFNISDDRGDLFADDYPSTNRVTMQVHFFLPQSENYITEKAAIRGALLDAGFTYPVIEMLTEDDTGVRHIVYECEISEREVQDSWHM